MEMLAAPIALMLMFVKPDGEAEMEFQPQPSTEVCWQAARRFVLKDPREHGAIALGAGCVVHHGGQSIQK